MDAKTANQMQMLAFASSPVIIFACECGDPACHQTVPLDRRAYHDLRREDRPVLHGGHTPLEDAALAGEVQWVSASEAHVRRVNEAIKVS